MINLILATTILLSYVTSAQKTQLLIYHTNNMCGRFGETKSNKGEGMGGFARIATLIKKARAQSKDGKGPSFLYIDGGSFSGCNVWFGENIMEITAEYMNVFEPDFVLMGIQDIAFSYSGLLKLSEKAKFLGICSNLFHRTKPVLRRWEKKLYTESNYIGVVAIIDPNPYIPYDIGDLRISDPIEALKNVMNEIEQTNVTLDMIIAIAHSTIETAKKIALEIEKINLIIMGFTHTCVCGKRLPADKSSNTVSVKRKNGSDVLIVHAHGYTKFLGKLMITIDKGTFNIKSELIPLDNTVKEDPEVLNITTRLQGVVKEWEATVAGRSRVFLDATSCRKEECNFGNLVADAFVHYTSSHHNGLTWTDTAIAIVSSGALTCDINVAAKEHFVTNSDIFKCLAFQDSLYVVEMKGDHLVEMLEKGLAADGSFLMVSGIKVIYSRVGINQLKVQGIEVRCADCSTPTYKPIVNDMYYSIIMNHKVVKDPHGDIKVKIRKYRQLTITGVEAVIRYFKAKKFVMPEVKGRLRFTKERPKSVGVIVLIHNILSLYLPMITIVFLMH